MLDNIFIQSGTKLYRQSVGGPMGTYFAFWLLINYFFCYERDFMICLSDDKHPDIIELLTLHLYILEDFENASPYFCAFLANRICDGKITHRF